LSVVVMAASMGLSTVLKIRRALLNFNENKGEAK
jgi:hypothetical protein